MRSSIRQLIPLATLLTVIAMLATLSASNASTAIAPAVAKPTLANDGSGPAQVPAGFRNVVFLSHVNDPATTPGFPGDPAFTLTTAFTVPDSESA